MIAFLQGGYGSNEDIAKDLFLMFTLEGQELTNQILKQV
jgi:hypothetical protein